MTRFVVLFSLPSANCGGFGLRRRRVHRPALRRQPGRRVRTAGRSLATASLGRLSTADFVEAAVRAGHAREAKAALDLCGQVGRRALTAKAEFYYGSWLRRSRRQEARPHPGVAENLFEHLDAVPSRDRAHAERRASGEGDEGSEQPAAPLAAPTAQELRIAVVILLIAVLALADSRTPTGRTLDWFGQVLAAIAVAALVYEVIEGGSTSWSSAPAVAGFAVAAVAALGFIPVALNVRSPMLDLALFRSRGFTGAVVVATIGMFALTGSLFVLSLYFGTVQHLSGLGIAWRIGSGRAEPVRPPHA
jgi:hypothetical protein